MIEHTSVSGADGGAVPPETRADSASADVSNEANRLEPAPAPPQRAEAIDLDKVRSEARGEGYREAALVAEQTAVRQWAPTDLVRTGRRVTVEAV